MKLRDYQTKAIAELRIHAKKSPILAAQMGAGKTVCMASMAQSAAAKGNRTVVVVHLREIVLQTAARFREYGVPCGVVLAEQNERDAQVVVASIQTLSRRAFIPAALLIIDEAHMACSESYRRLISAYRAHGATVVGASGTPVRLDGKGLGSVGFGHIVTPITSEELFAQGWLMRPKVYAPPSSLDLKGVRRTAGDYNLHQLEERVSRIVGDIGATWKKLAEGRKTIAFGVSIEHSKAIAGALEDAGARAAHVDSHDSDARRREVLGWLHRGEIDALSNVGILGVGFDEPSLAYCAMARPTLSLALYRQIAGRIMRPCPGKPVPILADHAGGALEHGLPWEEIEWSLDSKPKRAADPDRIIGVTTCPGCFAVVYTGTSQCPECGHELRSKAREPEKVDGELQELNERAARTVGTVPMDEMRAIVRQYIRDYPNAVNGFTEADVYSFASNYCLVLARGYKEGFASVRFNKRTGRWPPGDFANLRLRLAEVARCGALP